MYRHEGFEITFAVFVLRDARRKNPWLRYELTMKNRKTKLRQKRLRSIPYNQLLKVDFASDVCFLGGGAGVK